MKITQGQFSFLEELTDEQIDAQLRYAIGNGWALSIEYTDDPHPRNFYWEMWGLPRFDLTIDQSEVVLREVRAAREAFPEAYIKVIAYDPKRGRQTSAMSFIVNRPAVEHGFHLERTEDRDRVQRYRLVHLREAIGSVGVGNSAIRGNDNGGSVTE
jgi:ribulose-bisphosphate carboxylase small chain